MFKNSMYKDRLRNDDLIALIQTKQDRLEEIAKEERLIRKELVLLLDDLIRRGIEVPGSR